MGSLRLCGLLLVALQLFCMLTSPPTIMVAAKPTTTFDYGDALDKSLLFFEAQRSGYLPGNQRVKWRADSGLKDGFSEQVDLVGGYYDAGDHVKFGLPMAYSVTLISWAAVDFRSEVVAANQMDHTLQAIRWGTDYFVKHIVGDGEEDHSCWQRAEEMTTSRKASKLDSGHPGSDVAAETAAALAAASLAFKPYNSSYSTLLRHAKEIRLEASMMIHIRMQKRSIHHQGTRLDELLWAAAWLYRATNNNYYLQYASYNAAEFGGTGNVSKCSHGTINMPVLLDGDGKKYNETLKQYKEKADYLLVLICRRTMGTMFAKTPVLIFHLMLASGGLVFLMAWSNMQYAASASFLLAIYSDYLATSGSVLIVLMEKFSLKNSLTLLSHRLIIYSVKNPESMSYLIGYGTKYPQKAHHRGSSMPSVSVLSSKLGCVQGFEEWYKKSDPNPNILHGALIGGPDSSDCYTDDRDNYDKVNLLLPLQLLL
ncbi:Endoglucanase 5 [Bienertia sinuspersici]